MRFVSKLPHAIITLFSPYLNNKTTSVESDWGCFVGDNKVKMRFVSKLPHTIITSFSSHLNNKSNLRE
jgi:50S ribosomal subunit-associated GTPase HflX